MRAEEWMIRDVRTCRPETRMSEAAQEMWAGDCGILPVVDGHGRVVGMISDRDLCMGAHFQGRALGELEVGASMARSVFAVLPSASIEEVIRRMADEQVRRVPVIDARGELVGILSLNDLARRLVTLDERSRARLAPRLLEALASISETRAGAAVPEVAPPVRAAGQPSLVG